MVDPGILVSDILGNVGDLALPGLAWLFLFLVAWEDPEASQSSGFDRRVFWLLLPVGLLAEAGDLPFFAWDGNVLAVNVAGGLVPLILSVWFLRRLLAPSRAGATAFLAALAAETAVLFALVVLLPSGPTVDLAVLAVAALAPVGLALYESGRPRAGPFGATLALALASAGTFLTFLTTQAVPDVGIISVFPFYLIAPFLIGGLAGPVVWHGLRSHGAGALSLAYATTTIGTLVGADILRQPPLYGSGATGLLSIGGAGLLDLVYLSGLFAAAVAYGLYRLTQGRPAPGALPAATTVTAEGLLREALSLGYSGRMEESARRSAEAADRAVTEARLLRGAAPPAAAGGDPGWSGLGAPAWVSADHQNLEALAAQPNVSALDAGRAWTTARGLVSFGEAVGGPARASAGQRAAALGYDLAITLPMGIAVWFLVALTTSSPLGLLETPAFNAAALGYAGYVFLYLVLAEWRFGTTLGKRIVGIEVTDRAGQRPGPISCLVRNVPLLIPLTLLGVAGALIVAALEGATLYSAGLFGPQAALLDGLITLLVAVGASLGAGLALLVGWIGIHVTKERQRIGDYLAGTWVLRRRYPVPGRAGGAVRWS